MTTLSQRQEQKKTAGTHQHLVGQERRRLMNCFQGM